MQQNGTALVSSILESGSNVHSYHQRRNPAPLASIEDRQHDEDVMIAVHALGSLRHRGASTPSLQLSSPSFSVSPTLSASTSTAPSSMAETQTHFPFQEVCQDTFVSRVAELPLVNTALRAYDFSKANSRVVKFGSEMVESSVLSMTKPICDRLPVSQVNEFACRQLDRLSGLTKSPPSIEKAYYPMSLSKGQLLEESGTRRSNPGGSTDASGSTSLSNESRNNNANTVWQSVLLEAGGFSAAISAESIRRLKYCIQWLQYATSRVDKQIAALQVFINAPSEPHSSPRLSDSAASTQLQQIKTDLIQTLRQVVEIISKYAGGALPEPARSTVRNFVLTLPQRWATANANASDDGSSSPIEGRRSTRRVRDSRRSSPRGSPSSESANSTGVSSSGVDRLLMLATESLEMLRNVTNVFTQSLEKAENWVERLRVVGIDRQPLVTDREEPRREAVSSSKEESNSPARTQDSGVEESSTDSEREAPPKKTVKTNPRR